jgi:hypothetical protein
MLAAGRRPPGWLAAVAVVASSCVTPRNRVSSVQGRPRQLGPAGCSRRRGQSPVHLPCRSWAARVLLTQHILGLASGRWQIGCCSVPTVPSRLATLTACGTSGSAALSTPSASVDLRARWGHDRHSRPVHSGARPSHPAPAASFMSAGRCASCRSAHAAGSFTGLFQAAGPFTTTHAS